MWHHKNKKYIKCSFTLLELIVSMGIFSILMLMLMQFFSSTQKIWTESEKRNTTYADARVAMDLMSSMIQTSFYQYNAVPFYVDKNAPASGTSSFDKIYFVSNCLGNLDPSNARSKQFEVGYNVVATAASRYALTINYIGDNNTNFNYGMLPLASANITDVDVTTKQSGTSVIINYVTGLTFTPYVINSITNGMTPVTTDYIYYPYAVQIKLTLMDRNSYNKWQMLGGGAIDSLADAGTVRTFRENNQRTFTRMVYLGDRNE